MSDFIKYVDIERIGTPENAIMFDFPEDTVVVEEKVDGGNGCFFIEDGIIHVCSRNRDLTERKDSKTFIKQRLVLEKILYENYENINPDYLYYVEWMKKHTIFYGQDIIQVIGLDIKPKTGAFGNMPLFIRRKAKEEEFKKVGVACVSLKGEFKIKELTEEKIKELCKDSAYYEGKPEGVVIKNYNRQNVYRRQIFAKIVNDVFKETNRAVFGSIKKDTSDTTRIVDMCVNEARIRKNILYLIEQENMNLDKKLMSKLPVMVAQDVLKEEYQTIIKTTKTLHIKYFVQIIAKQCLATIDKMMCEKIKGE